MSFLKSAKLGFLTGVVFLVWANRSHAEEKKHIAAESALSVFQSPAGCLKNLKAEVPCYAQAIKSSLVLKFDNGDVQLLPGAFIRIGVKDKENSLENLEGTIAFTESLPEAAGAEKAFLVLHGRVRLRSFGIERLDAEAPSVILVSTRWQTEVYNSSRRPVILQRSGRSDLESLPAGAEVVVGRINLKAGEANAGIPVPFDLRAQALREAKFFKGKKEVFQARVVELKNLRELAAEELAKVHQEAMQRTVAAFEKKQQVLHEEKLKRQAVDSNLRKIFRKRFFEDQEAMQ